MSSFFETRTGSVWTDKRLLICVIAILVVALGFWSGSRYPDLNDKSLMAGEIVLEDSLSFEAIWPLSENPTVFERIAATFVNWLYVNWRGMSFGLVFAVVLMAVLSLIRDRLPSSSSGATLAGVVLGMPLGLCVNCAAPVAFGLQQRGARAETALTVMLSSPALNVVVLGIAVSLLPWYFYVPKILLTLLLVLVVVPVVCRYWPAPPIELDRKNPLTGGSAGALTEAAGPQPWGGAFKWFGEELLRQGFWLLRRMLPLMLLAGLLGAVLVTFLPWEKLGNYLPTHGFAAILLAMAALGLFALMLPVPIAFDVILVVILVSAGIADYYSALLLFALGSFSIYSYFVLWRANALRIANVIAVCVLLFSVLAGFATHYLGIWDYEQQQRSAYASLENAGLVETPYQRDNGGQLISGPAAEPVEWQSEPRYPGVIKYAAFQTNEAEIDGTMAARSAEQVGLKESMKPLIHYSFLSTRNSATIASGDIDGDGWPDVVLGNSDGVQVFANRGGRFEQRQVPALRDTPAIVALAALVDVDDNGWLDIVYATRNAGAAVAYNDRGEFQAPQVLPVKASVMPSAAAFGDVDLDGDLDMIWGHGNGLGWSLLSGERSRNEILYAQEDGWVPVDLPGLPGETLSILLADFNGDRYPDMWVGNDFDEPEQLYLSHGTHEWALQHPRGLMTTNTTMSVASGDVDNDLVMDTYHAQITGTSSRSARVVPRMSAEEYYQESCRGSETPKCALHRATLVTEDAVRKGRPSLCQSLDHYRAECIAAVAHAVSVREYIQGRDAALSHCEVLRQSFPTYFSLCDEELATETNPIPILKDYFKEELLQIGGNNLAYEWDGPAPVERAQALGIEVAGWVWNAKFADLDGDGWQDLFVANGDAVGRRVTSNVWYQNLNGEIFVESADAVGLTDYENTHAYTYIDYDRDGDLDIITHAASGVIRAYENRMAAHNHLQIELVDGVGNRFGVGSKITLYYGDGRHQMREIQASGGYLSFDPPVAHFGLGDADHIDKIEINWSTGESSTYAGPFNTGRRYRIVRPAVEPSAESDDPGITLSRN